MLETTTVVAFAAAIGVLITATMAVLQLRNLILQRKVNTVISLMPYFRPDMGREFDRAGRLLRSCELKNYLDFVMRFGDPLKEGGNNEVIAAFTSLANWYEALGLLYFNNYVDRKICFKMFAGLIDDWDYMKQIVYDVRKLPNCSGSWELFEFMAEDMRKQMRTV